MDDKLVHLYQDISTQKDDRFIVKLITTPVDEYLEIHLDEGVITIWCSPPQLKVFIRSDTVAKTVYLAYDPKANTVTLCPFVGDYEHLMAIDDIPIYDAICELVEFYFVRRPYDEFD